MNLLRNLLEHYTGWIIGDIYINDNEIIVNCWDSQMFQGSVSVEHLNIRDLKILELI